MKYFSTLLGVQNHITRHKRERIGEVKESRGNVEYVKLVK